LYLLSIFAPFLGSAFAGLGGRFFGYRGSWFISTIFMGFSFFLSMLIAYEVLIQGCPVSIDLGDWFIASSISAHWGIHVDSLTVCMMFTVTLVSLCVHIYSYDYMNSDPHLPRFMSYLSLFTGFMLFLVSADNMLQMLVGWEGYYCSLIDNITYAYFFNKKTKFKIQNKIFIGFIVSKFPLFRV
jgi:NADH:ubiquinone oxidoreductase subunit 5 (subunit L)/multisubunit Na+/H+ antiporter MnhA subunit